MECCGQNTSMFNPLNSVLTLLGVGVLDLAKYYVGRINPTGLLTQEMLDNLEEKIDSAIS